MYIITYIHTVYTWIHLGTPRCRHPRRLIEVPIARRQIIGPCKAGAIFAPRRNFAALLPGSADIILFSSSMDTGSQMCPELWNS